MSEFITKLDADTNSDGIQFSATMFQQFFDKDKDYLSKTKESRGKGVEDGILKLKDTEKKQLTWSIKEYLDKLDFELQDGQNCKITELLSKYPSFSEAMKAVKTGSGKSLNIACALLSLHSLATTSKRLYYEDASAYAKKYICEEVQENITNTNYKKDTIKEGDVTQRIDKLPKDIQDQIAGDENLNGCSLQDIQTYLKYTLHYDIGTSGPKKDGVDGIRGSRTNTALEKYFLTKKSTKEKEITEEKTQSKATTSGEFIGPINTYNDLDEKEKEKITPTIEESPKNDFEKEKIEITTKTEEIKNLVTTQSPQDIKDYIDKLRTDTNANPFITYMAIMGGLNHISDSDRTAIINNYYTILGDLKKQRKNGSTFQDDIALLENLLASYSDYQTGTRGIIGHDNSLLGVKDYPNTMCFDCSSYSFFVYCIMSEFEHKDIGIADNEAIQHGIFVRKNSSSGNITPYDFSNIKANGKSSGSQYEDGRNMKDNTPANISLLVSEYQAPQATIYTTYFAILGSESKGINKKTGEYINAYQKSLYDDFANSIRNTYTTMFENLNKKTTLTPEQIRLASDMITMIDSPIHNNIIDYQVSVGERNSLQYIKGDLESKLKIKNKNQKNA